jgi:hypothetical protein
LETFQVIFQLHRKDPSLKQSYISNLFKFKSSKTQVIQEFFLHVTLNEAVKNSAKKRGSIKTELTRKLALLLKHINKNRDLFTKLDDVIAHAYFVNNFKK